MIRRRFLQRLIGSAGVLLSGGSIAHADADKVLEMGIEAERLIRTGEYHRAVALVQQAMQQDPGSDWLHSLLGRAHAGLGDTAAALSEFRQILRADPDNDLARTWVELLSQRPVERSPGSTAANTSPPSILAEQEAYRTRLRGNSGTRGYRITRIVIDAGHGGFDPGAGGPTGLQEKSVTLAFARALEASLRRHKPALRLFQTRLDDYYVPLSERTAVANQHNADLFLSVHCNAHRRPGARGAETYYCSEQASSAEARRVADMENTVLEYEPPPRIEAGSVDIEHVLFQLMRRQYWRESARLAQMFQTALVAAASAENRGVHSADFFVLRKARMPAVLLEIAFISHREEERMLRSASALAAMADGVARKIVAV